ncbi:unnamed protein product [Allacma fusca]|uniref:Uncharacterized protein n=1 Tax=Allacma fusca TaxID=39272 RepID=A0A8J2NS93_9HEXA|nr:unnamed protein product [Allacma fusca]
MNTQLIGKTFMRLLIILLACILTLEICLTSAGNSGYKDLFFVKHQTKKNITTWKGGDWLNWMKKREIKRFQLGGNNDPKSALTVVGLNTVINANKQTILDAFNASKGTLKPYSSRPGNNIFWSKVKLPTHIVENNNGKTRVYHIPDMFIAAGLDNSNRPVHLETFDNSTKPKSGKRRFPFGKYALSRLPITPHQSGNNLNQNNPRPSQSWRRG